MPDELEALRMADQLGLYHEDAAERMRVSRPTFSRIVATARAKVADALVNGKAIIIVSLPNALNIMEDPMPGTTSDEAPYSTQNTIPRIPASVCIPIALDRGIDSKLVNHFGAAPLFAIVSMAERTVSVLENDMDHHHGGRAPVETIVAQHVDSVIVTGIGGGAYRRLVAHGVNVYKGRPGPISAVIDDLAKGILPLWDPADNNTEHGFGHGRSGGSDNAQLHEHGHGCAAVSGHGCRHEHGHGHGMGRNGRKG